MPSFRFRGFTDASTVALTIGQGAQSADADLVWAQALTTPSATFSIARFDTVPNAELIAPVALWFTPTAIQGFLGIDGQPISEPTGDANVYDPTAIEIFWSWDFGDPGYVPLVPTNLPSQLRDVNRAYAKRPCHVMHAPGPKTVSLFGYDTRGNWGTATYTFGPGGDSPAIIDPDSGVFAGRDLYFSMQGNFPPEAPLGSRFTTVAAVNSRIVSLSPSIGPVNPTYAPIIRLRLRRGEEYVDIPELGAFRTLYIDSYGDPEDPPPKQIRTGVPISQAVDGAGPFAIQNGDARISQGASRIIDQDWQGPYDAATETGPRLGALIRTGSANGNRHLIHRCRMSGMGMYFDVLQDNLFRTFSDILVTNWQDYGLFLQNSGQTLAIIGGDLAQHVDALSGTHHGTANSNFANLTNRHGPIRHGGTRDLYVACTSYLARNGWSQRSSSQAGNTDPATLAQACHRHAMSESQFIRNYATWERCSFEGGAGGVHFVDLGAREPSTAHISNILFESNILIASRDTEGLIFGKGQGLGARNNYFFVPAVPHIGAAEASPRHASLLNWAFEGSPNLERPSKALLLNNTGYILANNAQIGTVARVLADVNANHNPTNEQGVLWAPNLTVPIGAALGPFTTPTLSGIQGRFKGTKFNFPPIGHDSMGPLVTAQSVRELSPGGTTGVANGEWISLLYPNYTGKNNGALGQVTRAMVESALPGGGVRYHQVSIHDQNVKAAASAAAGGDGRVAFAFTDTHIRVQNLSGVTWLGNLWVLLDLRDRLMGFVPGTANPVNIPILVPASTAGATSTGLSAPNDFFGAPRTLPAVPGAFVPAI